MVIWFRMHDGKRKTGEKHQYKKELKKNIKEDEMGI